MPDDKTPACECGYAVTATDEAGRVEEIRSHAQAAHGIAFSIEDALLVLLRSELDLSRDSSQSGINQ
jgi:predicted small metal-binding protein